MTKHIDPETVDAIFLDCLFRTEEVADGKLPDDAIVVEGVINKVKFHRQRVESYRDQVRDYLNLLPPEFRKSGGGGWTFLNACNEADGTQWTGLQERMDQLFMLGIGLGLVKWQLPREIWDALPGGMPYLLIEI